jgi:beta-lactamase class A
MNLHAAVEGIIADFSGEVAVSARMLDGSQALEIDSHRVLPTASVIKVPIMAAVYEQAESGRLVLGERVPLEEDEKRGGSGILKAFEPGVAPTIKDIVTLMIILSDNTATNMAIDSLSGGIGAVNDLMARRALTSIELRNRIDFEVVGDDITKLGVASPSDMRRLMEGIANRTLLSPDSCEAMEGILEQQQYLNQFPRFMRVTPYWRELGQIPEIIVANKTGFFIGTRVDAGIVRFPGGSGFTYCVVNDKSADESFLPDAEGDVANGRIGVEILRHWWPEQLGPAPLSPPHL